MSATRNLRKVDRLADRFLDPRRTFGLTHDELRRRLTAEDPDAARRWHRRLAFHRALVGAERASGLEDARNAALLADRVLGAARPTPRRWWVWSLAAVAVALLFIALRKPAEDPAERLAARGQHPMATEPVVGFGVAGLGEDDLEYDVLGGALQAGDWVRLSYTNERADLDHLFLVALVNGGIVWLVPTPEDGMSLPIRESWLTNLEVETRVADTSAPPGEVLFIGIFSREAISVTAMRRALDTLPATGPDLDSGAAMVENHLRSSLALGPFDLVQIATTRIVAASAPHPHPPTDGAPTDTRQEAP